MDKSKVAYAVQLNLFLPRPTLPRWTQLTPEVHEAVRELVIQMMYEHLPKPVQHWSLTTLREKLVKIGAKVTRHAKYVTFQLAEVAVTRNLFATILNRIARLAIPPPLVE